MMVKNNLLIALAVGSAVGLLVWSVAWVVKVTGPPACISEFGSVQAHQYGQWEVVPRDKHHYRHQARRCETCGWTQTRTH